MMTTNNADNLLNNTFKITIEPKQNFHFRYGTELKNSHGYLNGQTQLNQSTSTATSLTNNNDIYPRVKLLLPQGGNLDDFSNKRDFFILCTLHNVEKKCLSPHLLLAKGQTQVNFECIFEKMEENVDNPLERHWQLKEYVIVRLKNEEFKKSLEAKCIEYRKLQLPLDFGVLKGDLDINDDKSVKISGILNVCLGFTVFEKDFYSNTYRLYKETIFSKNIYHGDDIKIHHLCNTKGSLLGGTSVTLLIKLNSNFPLNIRLTKIDEVTKDTVWEKLVAVQNKDIFGKHAITFTLPPYGGPRSNDDEIEVNIEVVVSGTTYKSQNVKFYYLNNTEDIRSRKRPRRQQGTEEERSEEFVVMSEASSSSCNSDSSVFEGINQNNIHFPLDHIMETNDINDRRRLPSIESFVPNPEWGPISQILTIEDDIISFELISEYDLEAHQPSCVSRDRVERPMNEINSTVVDETVEIFKNIDFPRREPSKPTILKNIIKKKINQILKSPKNQKDIVIKGHINKDGNTIFHEALVFHETFIHLYKTSKDSAHKNLILDARNKKRENLLHLACKHNKANCIRPLIGMGIRIHNQDLTGSTPLHIAMDNKYTDCILKIQQLLQDHSQYPKEVVDNFVKMFRVYNHQGYTVLHQAILENRVELVETMLQFCALYNFNVIDYEVLGNGDSVVHLVVKNNLLDMVGLIQKYIPYYLTIQNYPGTSILELPDTSTEMLKSLKIQI